MATSFRKRKKRGVLESDESDVESGNEPSDTASVRSLVDEHKSVLLTVYHDEIASGKLLTRDEVRSKMRADLYLRKLMINADFVKKVADFVRYKCNLTRQLQLSQLEELDVDTEYVVPSVSLESGLRRVWSSHDAAVIKAKFEALPKIPRKEILEMFSSDAVLSHILERRCYPMLREG